MPTNTNEQIVRQIFNDFLDGNIQSVINALADDIRWFIPGHPDIPFAGSYKGKNEVMGFFQKLNQHFQYQKLEPQEYLSQGNIVAVLGYEESTALDTGNKISGNWAMRWEINNGKVIDYKYYDDTLKLARAYKK